MVPVGLRRSCGIPILSLVFTHYDGWVLQEVECLKIIKCSFVPCVFSSVVQVDLYAVQIAGQSRSISAFQVPFQVHKNKLSSLHLQYAVATGLERSLNILNPLEMPLEMLCICEFDHCKKFPVSRNSSHF